MEGKYDYARFISTHRKASGYRTQKQFAEATEISRATISRIEDGKHRPAPETIQAFAKKMTTTNIAELMVVCGYWDEADLPDNNQIKIKENSPSYSPEKEFLDKIELSDDELIKQFGITVDGRKLTDQEMKKIIAFVRMERQFGDRD